MIKSTLLSALLLLGVYCAKAQSTFSVTATGTNSTIDAAITYTTNIWTQYLNSAIPIKVNVVYTNLTGAGPLAVTFPNGEKDFSGAPKTGTWYSTCLANSIAGIELNPGEFDMDIYVNSAVDYYFGTDGNPGINQYDFVSVFLHEIAHGLGALSLTKIDAGIGSFGLLDSSSTAPFTASFPFPQLNGLPSVWDSFLINGSGQLIADTLIFTNVSNVLGSEFESDDLYFSGPSATVVNGGSTPKIFAPNTYESGSSLQHFDEASFPNPSGNSLLTPYFFNAEVEHDPGDLLMAALTDIGWSTVSVGVSEMNELSIVAYPNPVENVVQFKWNQHNNETVLLHLYSSNGKLLRSVSMSSPLQVDMSEMATGIYIYKAILKGAAISGILQKR
jgi:hypothetical protein